MKKFMMLLAAGGLALGLVALTPEPADAGKGWRGGHYGKAWRGWRGPRYAYRGWRGPRYGYRGWRGYGWGGYGWGGWWGPAVGIYIGPGWYGRRCWSPRWGYVPCRYGYGYWGY
jgi:hypothetical protein